MFCSLATAAIYFIACHGGPADHFATFADELTHRGYAVHVYATGPALQKLQDQHVDAVIPFSLEEDSVATEIAKQCCKATVVITDVGHAFDIALQRALHLHAPNALRLAYYDNPEAYVPGGYSSTAAQVMPWAQGVLFANANLAAASLYQAPGQEISQLPETKIGLGYYPMRQAETIAKRRASERAKMRREWFCAHGLQDEGQQLLVYAGGNNEEYVTHAFPAFLRFLREASERVDLSKVIVVLQQHPGARARNLDANLVQQWVCASEGPLLVVSTLSSDDAQVVVDGMLYYQTSMGPQFILAGIPTIQVGHQVYEDVLVRNGLCSVATNTDAFIEALQGLPKDANGCAETDVIRQGLGLCSDWADRLEQLIYSATACPYNCAQFPVSKM